MMNPKGWQEIKWRTSHISILADCDVYQIRRLVRKGVIPEPSKDEVGFYWDQDDAISIKSYIDRQRVSDAANLLKGGS